MEKTTQLQKKPPKLTKKQRGFVEDYVASGNASESIKKNYNVTTDLTARTMGSENITKPNVALAIEIKQQSLREALIKQGVTPEKIAQKVETLLNATEKIGILGKEYETPDYNAIDKGLKHATTIYGVISDDENPRQANTYNFIFSPENQKDIREIEEKIKARLIKKNV